MILAMVRHGQTNFNMKRIIQGRTDNPLNQEGRFEALNVANMLLRDNKTFDEFLSSPLSRALETAFIISKNINHDKPIHIVPQFVERDFSQLEGQLIDLGMPLVRQKGYTHPGYEDDKKLVKRIVAATLKLEDKYIGQEVLCVAHSHVIKSLLVHVDPHKYTYSNYNIKNWEGRCLNSAN